MAQKLSITDVHVVDLIDEGQLRAINIAAGSERKHWRIPVEAYYDFVRKQDSLTGALLSPARPKGKARP